MAKSNFLISIFLLVIFFLITLFLSLNAHKKLSQSAFDVQNTQNQAEKYAKLKNSWSHKSTKIALKRLQNIANARVSDKRKYVKFNFDHLSKSELDKVVNIIYKRSLPVQKLVISNRDNKAVSLYLEVTK